MALYGILDCAASETLYEQVMRLEPGHAQCMYEGRLHETVRANSPWVVELEPSDPLSVAWRGQGWTSNWGILLSSTADLRTVRRRLRHFTQAKLPTGEGPVLFRFWDPRVFRVYMPLVEPAELGQWFIDIDRYIAPTEDGAGSIRYSMAGDALKIDQGPAPTR